MKFPQMTRAPEGLTSYARVKRVRPVQTVINIAEALLSLVGVVLLILWAWNGSFAAAGTAMDGALARTAAVIAALLPK